MARRGKPSPATRRKARAERAAPAAARAEAPATASEDKRPAPSGAPDERSKETGGGDHAGSAGGAGGNAPRGITERGKETGSTDPLVRRHLAWGWWSLAVFTTLGLVLEAAHGLKLGWYVDLTSATRRLSFTLAHAHGTLLGLVHIAFALSLGRMTLSPVATARASFALRAVSVLLPLGFLLGGVGFYDGDPGFAIVLVPPSGALLVIALAIVARGASRG
jgi:hypothetical protein